VTSNRDRTRLASPGIMKNKTIFDFDLCIVLCLLGKANPGWALPSRISLKVLMVGQYT
jgi:hypothetical protein